MKMRGWSTDSDASEAQGEAGKTSLSRAADAHIPFTTNGGE